MKTATVKTFTSVHTWTGLAAGMALFIAFYTGAITVFTHELEAWDSYSETTPGEQSYADAQQLVDRVLEADPDAAADFRLYPSRAGHPGNVVRWFERLDDGTFDTHEYRLTDSDALDTTEDNAHLAGFIYRLHYTAGLPSSFGLYVLGIVCMIYGLAILTGLLIFLPNWLKDLFIVRAGRNKKRFWLDAHNVVGVISLPWHFMFAWSSAILAIGIFFLAPFQFLVFDEDLLELFGLELGLVPPVEAAGVAAPLVSVADIMTTVQGEFPGLVPEQVRYANAGDVNGTVAVYGHLHAGTLSPNATVTFNSATGEILNISDPRKATVGATLYSGLISLHFVTFGGFTAKWVYFFLGLAGAFLFYSGNLLWVESRRKRRRTEQPATTRFLARLNSGVCIGCMAGVSAAFLMSRAAADLPNRADLTELAYYAIFLASVAYCFVRPVAYGARDLLYLSGALTAAIPVFDAVIIDRPMWLSLMAGEWALFTVDLLAVLGAVAFWRMGRAVQRRAQTGEANSVWSTPVALSDATTSTLPASEVPVSR